MEIIKIVQSGKEITSNVFEESFSMKEFLEGQVLDIIKKACEIKKYDGGVFLNLELASSELNKMSHRFSEVLNLPFIEYDPETDLVDELNKAKEHHKWTISYFDYPKGKEEYSIESLLTVGNGYFGLRGTTPEMLISDANYPATYIAGVYNTLESTIGENKVENEDFVNLPNAQKIYLVVGKEVINIENNDVMYLRRELNLKTGELFTRTKIALKTGGTLEVKSKKIASMSNKHFYGIHYQFKVTGNVSDVKLISEIDGDVFNYNVERYRKLEKSHLITLNLEAKGNLASLECVTNSSGIKIVQESQLRSESIDLTKIQNKIEENKIKQTVELDTVENEWYALEKIVYVAKDIKDARTDYPTYTELLTASKKEWESLWEKASVKVEGDMMSQKMLNLHTYHMLTSGSPKGNKELDASITARGLHGEAYRGHIFWDELFILPFFMLHFPDTAKELLMYRYNRLEMAKVLAKEEGYEGAMYPWQSGLDGSEQSQKLHLNPLSGKWKEDHSRRQRHVSLAIAYNVWMYYLQTEDEVFLKSYGLEMLLEISQFWLSLATYDDQTNRYSINGVMGPDEFHEAYSDREKGGLDNNAYTNLMVAWMFGVMTELKSMYPLETSLDWQKVEKMRKSLQLDINSEGIIAQFDGYFDLEEIDWTAYREKYGNIYRMDRILNAEGKTADDFKVAKQADSLMIFYNLPKETVTNLLSDLSYSLPDDYVKKNLLYYLERTSHGSTLSRVVHSQLAEMVNNRELAWELYQEALYSDYRDIQGGTTAEGVHTGVMASTLSITLTAFAGLDIRGEKVKFNPHLPEQWQSLSFSFQNKGCEFSVYLNHDTLEITSDKNCVIKVTDRLVELKANKTQIISY